MWFRLSKLVEKRLCLCLPSKKPQTCFWGKNNGTVSIKNPFHFDCLFPQYLPFFSSEKKQKSPPKKPFFVVKTVLYIFQVKRSDGQRVHLWKVDWFTKGEYRCEVTADDFETSSSTVETDVVGNFFERNGGSIALISFPSWYCSRSQKRSHHRRAKDSLFTGRNGQLKLHLQRVNPWDRALVVCQLQRGEFKMVNL